MYSEGVVIVTDGVEGVDGVFPPKTRTGLKTASRIERRLTTYSKQLSVPASAAASSATTGSNTFLSAVVVSIAVAPSVYWIVYLRALRINATTVPSHTWCPSSCVATVRPI